MKDLLVLVNDADEEVGQLTKLECHLGGGKLHRAFSVFIFNASGELLLQQRSAEKMLWPGYWSNSCCSHPRPDENILAAGGRRLYEELGFTVDLRFIFKFNYQARYKNIGSENELCSVLVGEYSGKCQLNKDEVKDIVYLSPEDIDRQIQAEKMKFTPWFLIEWREMKKRFLTESYGCNKLSG